MRFFTSSMRESGIPISLRVLFLSLLGIAAYCSDGVLHPDEYQQVLEFFFYKKGVQQDICLPWEFREQIRSWLQPLFYWVVSMPFGGWISTPLGWTRFFRFLMGMMGGWGFLFLSRHYLSRWKEERSERGLQKVYLASLFFCLLPLYLVRTSSENFAAILLLFLIGLVFRNEKTADVSPVAWGYYGLLCGLGFLARYQSGIWIVGFFLWGLFLHGPRISWIKKVGYFATAFLGMMLVGLCLDRVGYGNWGCAPWGYFAANILQDKAAQWGTSPFWGYITLFMDMAPPFGGMVFFGSLGFFLLFPRHVLTWILLPYVVVHAAIPHKELRFLLPLFYFFPLMGVELYRKWAGICQRGIIAHFVHAALVLLLIWNGVKLFQYVSRPVQRHFYVLEALQPYLQKGPVLLLADEADVFTWPAMPSLDTNLRWQVQKKEDSLPIHVEFFWFRNQNTENTQRMNGEVPRKNCEFLVDRYSRFPDWLRRSWVFSFLVRTDVNGTVYHCMPM